MYTKNLIAHRGTDNQILIEFVNQDQKRVDITGKVFTLRIISHNGEELLLEKPLIAVNETQGQAKLVLTESELDDIIAQTAMFSIEQVSTGSLYEPVYVDDNAGARGNIDIVDSIMPSFMASKILTIPDHPINIAYVTSVLETNDVDLHTFQFELDQFTGTIEAKGAVDATGPWYSIEVKDILSLSDLITFNVEGSHPYIRFTITETAGTITNILYR